MSAEEKPKPKIGTKSKDMATDIRGAATAYLDFWQRNLSAWAADSGPPLAHDLPAALKTWLGPLAPEADAPSSETSAPEASPSATTKKPEVPL